MNAANRRSLSRVLLAISLLAGTAVNLYGARGFVFDPLEAAQDLGLPLVKSAAESASREARSAITFLHLSATMLIVLAVFYALTAYLVWIAQDVTRYADLVGFAVFARLTGVLFYAVEYLPRREPKIFLLLLGINLALAVLHAAFLGKEGWRKFLRT
jgi:hypothetical protein